MMKILLKACKIVSPQSEFNGQTKDILINDGIIEKIEDSITDSVDQLVELENLHVSVGWFDARVNFCDPGNEVMEDLESGIKAAEAGGISAVGLTPDTVPTISNKSQIDYVQNRTAYSAIDIHPYGTLTEGMQGEKLSEMYEMQSSGAIGFTDSQKFVSAGIMYRALLYAKNFDGKVISFPLDQSVTGKGFVHEGKTSVLTGLKSIPSIAETLMVDRDLSLVEYTDGSIHFSGVSTKESVELIRTAKAEGKSVTCDTYLANILFTDEDLLGFDSNYKVLPPIRAAEDRQALIDGILDDTIDFVSSDHRPQDVEHKEVEFDQASFGMIGVQTLFSALNTLEELSLEKKIELISENPRKVFGKSNSIKVGESANLTLFNPDVEFTLEENQLHSKSKNTPLIGKKLKGSAYGIVNRNILTLNN